MEKKETCVLNGITKEKVKCLQQFAKRWERKFAHNPKSSSAIAALSCNYDKFIVRYIVFDALTGSLFGESQKCQHWEQCKDNPKEFFVSAKCVDSLFDKLNNDAESLKNEIYKPLFNFMNVDEKEGCKLKDRWTSDCTDKSAALLDLLRTLYHLRCNLFHGHKDFTFKQNDLMTAAANCMKILNDTILEILEQNIL